LAKGSFIEKIFAEKSSKKERNEKKNTLFL